MRLGVLILFLFWPAAAFAAVQILPHDPKSTTRVPQTTICVSNWADRMVAYFVSGGSFVHFENEKQPPSRKSTHYVWSNTTDCHRITSGDFEEIHVAVRIVEIVKDFTAEDLMGRNEKVAISGNDGTQVYPPPEKQSGYFPGVNCPVVKPLGRHVFAIEETDDGIACKLSSSGDRAQRLDNNRKTKPPEKALRL